MSVHQCPVLTEPGATIEEATQSFLHEAYRRDMPKQPVQAHKSVVGILEDGRGSLWECKRHGEAGKEVDFSKLSGEQCGERDQGLRSGLVVSQEVAPAC